MLSTPSGRIELALPKLPVKVCAEIVVAVVDIIFTVYTNRISPLSVIFPNHLTIFSPNIPVGGHYALKSSIAWDVQLYRLTRINASIENSIFLKTILRTIENDEPVISWVYFKDLSLITIR